MEKRQYRLPPHPEMCVAARVKTQPPEKPVTTGLPVSELVRRAADGLRAELMEAVNMQTQQIRAELRAELRTELQMKLQTELQTKLQAEFQTERQRRRDELKC